MARNVPEFEQQRGRVSRGILPVNFSEASPVSPLAGRSSTLVGETLRKISSRMEDRADIHAATEATREGRESGKNGVPQLRDEATIKGAAFNQAARDAVRTDFDLRARLKMDELEEEHKHDPVGFSAAFSGFSEGHISALREQGYEDIAQDIEGGLSINSRNALRRIEGRAEAIARDRQIENALRMQIKMQSDIEKKAFELFGADPADVPSLMEDLTGSAAKLTETASHIGADGKPLFSARQRIAMEQGASEALGRSIGMAYMQSQPDLLAGYEMFKSGEAKISMIDGDGEAVDINLDDILDPAVKAQVKDAFVKNLRNDLSLRSQIASAQEREFKKQSDALYSDMTVALQDGRLTLNIVEASKASLEPDRYLALRELAKAGGASVSDGRTLARLAVGNANGEDIRDDALGALRSGLLTNDDFVKYYEDNTSRLNVGTRDAVQTGRDYLTKGLGALSSEIGFAQSTAIGAAQAEYEIEIEKFTGENGRQPTTSEARDLAEGLRARYSVLSAEDSLLALPLPRSLTQAEKLSKGLSSGVISDRVKTINSKFLAKHAGDNSARDRDPEYLEEIKLLKQYYDLLKAKEENNVR